MTLDDFTPEARGLTCDQIADERHKIADALQAANSAIAENRTRNEVLLVIFDVSGLAAAPILLATDNHDKEKDTVAQLYERRDTLIKLAGLKHCSPPPSP